MNMKIENWWGYDIRFIEHEGEWYATLEDICYALSLDVTDVAENMSSLYIESVPLPNDSRTMLAVSEIGVYEALFTSDRPEARRFRRWSSKIMMKLRSKVGLESYQAMKLTEPEVQEEIDFILDSLYFDNETGKWMQSVTVRGGDVEQVEFK